MAQSHSLSTKQQFIRAAAIALAAAVESNPNGEGSLRVEAVWRLAERLWAAKPPTV